jgi:hypothetical protein
MTDKQELFLAVMQAHPPLPGNRLSIQALSLAFSQMATELRVKQAPAAEQEGFQFAISLAITSAPDLTLDERRSVANALFSAFDGLPRKTTVSSVHLGFLKQVRFDGADAGNAQAGRRPPSGLGVSAPGYPTV